VPSLKTDLLPVEGPRRTDLALEKAAQLLRQAGSHKGQVILVTDGLDHPAAADEAARKLLAEGYRVSVLGVGTAKGAPVPLGDGGFLKDTGGAILMPRLEPETLQALAAAGGGRFVVATLDDTDVDTLIPEPGAFQGTKVKRQDLKADQWREEGPWLLLALLPLAALAFRRGWLGPLVLVVLLMPPPARAFDWEDLWLRPDEQAARALAAGKAAEAADQFQRPDWRAAAQYQAGDYDAAMKALAGMKGSQADYNRGNALARLGKLEDAVKSYDQALAADPKNADARYNRDLVQKLLEQQKRQERQSSGQGKSSDRQQGKGGQQSDSPSGQHGQGQKQAGQQGQRQGQEGKQQDQKGGNRKQAAPQQDADSRKQDQGGGKGSREQAAKEREAGKGKRQDQKTAQGAGAGKQKDNRQPPSAAEADKEKKGSATQPEGQSPKAAQTGENKPRPQGEGPEPGRSDLLGNKDRDQRPPGAQPPPQDPAKREKAEAMEEMLRRVPDDPGGLLRQRFLLQHLRRTGQMP
jgi:Ca-activated chloride channel family protein